MGQNRSSMSVIYIGTPNKLEPKGALVKRSKQKLALIRTQVLSCVRDSFVAAGGMFPRSTIATQFMAAGWKPASPSPRCSLEFAKQS